MRNSKKSLKNILVIGADSFLAKSFVAKYNSQFNIGLSSRNSNYRFDILKDKPSCLPLKNYQIFIIYIGATGIKFCEENPDVSEQVNFCKTVNLIKEIHKYAEKIIIFSSSLVFSTDINNLKSNYAIQKFRLENFILNNSSIRDKCIIIKPTKIISVNNNPLNEFLKAVDANCNYSVFNDFYLAPISLRFFNQKLFEIINDDTLHDNIVKISGMHSLSYYDLFEKILKLISNNYSKLSKTSYKFNAHAILSFQSNPVLNINSADHEVLYKQDSNSFINDICEEIKLTL